MLPSDRVAVTFLVVVCSFVLVIAITSARAHSKCLEAGWPSAKIDWKLNAYCVRRVDQTDVVERLDAVRGRK